MKQMNGIIEYLLELKKDQQTVGIDEVAAALKKMKIHKASDLSRLVAEMIQATGILELSGYWIYVMIL